MTPFFPFGYFDRRRIARAWFACASLFCAGAGLACFVEREFGMFPPTSLRPFIIAGGVVLMLVAVVWMHSLRAGFLPTLSTGVVHPVIGIDSPEVTNHDSSERWRELWQSTTGRDDGRH